MPDFEPRILMFACNWCSYAGADLAGISRKQYPTGVRIIRVMCSGRVEPLFVMAALENGADGVLITGCHMGDCHYQTGNVKAEGMVKDMKEILETLGIGEKRLRLEWISASEGNKFADAVIDFTEEIAGLGPNPVMTSASEAER